MSLAMYAIGGLVANKVLGQDAADSAEEGAATAAEYQQRALDYLKETEKVPQQYRTAGTEALGGLYGLGSPEQNAAAMGNYQNSPINQLMTQNSDAALRFGEQGIARNATATGGLRGGDVQASMYDYNTMFKNQQQQRMLSNYLSGLGSMSQLQTNPEAVYTGTANIGNTLASGQLAGAQAKQQVTSTLANLGGAFLSDVRLKENIKHVGVVNSHNWYSWLWNEAANRLGLSGESQGVIAQEVLNVDPSAIGERSGFLTVDYSKILAGGV